MGRVRGRVRRAFSFWFIDDASLARDNNFHLIRLAAALLVLFAHAFHLLDRAGEEPIGCWLLTMDASLLGVTIFFVISGFLVARSWARRASLPAFVLARALRIAPALWLALAFTVLVAGPLFTALTPGDYSGDIRTWKYLLLNMVLRTQYLLPGVFEANPLPGVNGSLWTIPLEVVLYLALAVAGWSGLACGWQHVRARVRTTPWLCALLLVVAALLVAKIARTGAQYYGLALYFVLGAAFYRVRHRVGLNPLLAAALMLVAVIAARTDVGRWLMPVALPYAILVLALHPALRMRPTWLHKHDYSYGTYLYGFPLQQAAIAMGVHEPMTLLALCAPMTLAFAALSWHLVERRALALKSRWAPVGESSSGDRFSNAAHAVTPPDAHR